jgi:hypothetical protein
MVISDCCNNLCWGRLRGFSVMVIVSSSMFVTFIPIYYRENRTPDFFSLSSLHGMDRERDGTAGQPMGIPERVG